ncbi:MAG: DNA helicase, partial [Lachnospiraceae bacterium]|nr:DNA helicase [Lachnospiraceae bacterium]
MNTKKHLIILKGEIKTSEIKYCKYNAYTQKMDIEFNSGKSYPYAYSNVKWLKEPQVLNPKMYRISKDGRIIFGIEEIYVFQDTYEAFWHICFSNGSERDYLQSELKIIQSCLNQSQSGNVFE